MEQLYYLIGLIVSIVGLLLIDRRLKLAFWNQPRRTLLTIAIAMDVFIIWDFFGIFLGIFFQGGSRYALPFTLLPEFPLEELFFLFLLCYVSLLVYLGVKKRWQPI